MLTATVALVTLVLASSVLPVLSGSAIASSYPATQCSHIDDETQVVTVMVRLLDSPPHLASDICTDPKWSQYAVIQQSRLDVVPAMCAHGMIEVCSLFTMCLVAKSYTTSRQLTGFMSMPA